MSRKAMAGSRTVFVYAPGPRFRQRVEGLGKSVVSSLRVKTDPPVVDPPCRGEAFTHAFIEWEPGFATPGASWVASLAVLHPRAKIYYVVTDGRRRGRSLDSSTIVSGMLTVDEAVAAISRAASSSRRHSGSSRRPRRRATLETEQRMVLADTVLERQGEASFIIQDGIVTYIAMPLLEELGWLQEEVIGHHFAEYVAPVGRPYATSIHKARLSGKPAPSEYETIMLSKGGKQVPVELYVRVVEVNGRPASIGTMRDITERQALREARQDRERQIHLLSNVTRSLLSGKTLASSLGAILQILMKSVGADRGCICLSIPREQRIDHVASLRMRRTRFERWDPVAGDPGCLSPSRDVIRRLGSGRPIRRAPCKEVAHLGGNHLLVPFVHGGALGGLVWLLRSGGSRWTESEVALLSSISGEVALGIEYWRLLDDLKASYSNLLETQKELLHKQRLAVIGNMAGHLAHEIRNPLATIMNATGQVGRRLNLSGVEAELLEIVEEELARLRRICDDLVLFSRSPRPRPRAIRLGEFLCDIRVDLQRTRQIPEKLDMVIEVTPSDLEASQDPDILSPLVRQMVINAYHAFGIQGTLHLRAYVGKRDELKLEVGGSGPGIPPHIVTGIFDPFSAANPEVAGLGLAIVRYFVVDLGGDLAVECADDKCSWIRLTLPPPPAMSSE